MRVVLLLKAFLARCVQVMAAGSDNIIAAISRGIPDWLVLAHEEDCDGRGNAAQGAGIGADVDMMPGASISKPRLAVVSIRI